MSDLGTKAILAIIIQQNTNRREETGVEGLRDPEGNGMPEGPVERLE